MNGGAERARHPDSARISRPHPSLPHDPLNWGIRRVPTGLGRGRKREMEEQRPGESEFCFNLKRHCSLHQNTHAAASTYSHTTPPSLESLSLAFKRVSMEPTQELKIPQTRGPRCWGWGRAGGHPQPRPALEGPPSAPRGPGSGLAGRPPGSLWATFALSLRPDPGLL